MRYLSVKNFTKHQHYKDRRPPWIKLHVEVLDDYAFACLQDASKAHLMLLWVLASKLDNRIPYDLSFLSRKLGCTSPIDVDELVLQGFIEVSQDDSKVIAPRKQSAMLETETEAEAEREAEVKAPPKARGKGKLDVLPKVLCDAGYEAWIARIGGVDYGRYRKALLPLYESPTTPGPTEGELVAATEAFTEQREADKSQFRATYTVERFAGDMRALVRLGGMPHMDEWGDATERGRIAGYGAVA